MAAAPHFIAEIAPGKVDWKFQARVIRLWTVPNMKNNDEINSLEMLLLDEHVIVWLFV